MTRFFIIIAVGLAAYLIYVLYAKELLKKGKAGKIQLGLIAAGLLLIAMVAMMRAPAFFALIGAALTQAMRIAPLLVRYAPWLAKNLGLQIPGMASSTLRASSLLLTMDSQTGQIDGTVLQGSYNGKRLSELNNDDLLNFYQACEQSDPEALQLLQTYISRERKQWSGSSYQQSSGNAQANEELSIREACDILGVKTDANKKMILEAYRVLMRQLHPDKGGSNYLAAKVNAAKQLLLKQLNGKDS